jgi:hypothetical protein
LLPVFDAAHPIVKITLCVIHGNESRLIERILTSFAPAFDELSLVRASGAAKPDDTEAKALAWCDAAGKRCLCTTYANHPSASTWEHVDDFGAARNASFAQGNGEWLIWADCDDVAQDAVQLRALIEAAPAATVLLRFPYNVLGTGKRPLRERCLRRATWDAGARWSFPVHENLQVPPGSQVADYPGPEWIHSPLEILLASRQRNLRILSRVLKDTAMNFFYLHQEHYCAGNKKAAEAIADLVVQFPNLDESFRAEALLNIARVTTDRDKAFESVMAAHGKLPWCREPLAALVMMAFEQGKNEKALHWARQLCALPEPGPGNMPWTHEPKWYDWAGDDLLARALRLTGNIVEAASMQDKFHGSETPLFTLCHATRGRTSQALQCRETWLSSADRPRRVEHVFAVDADDKESVQMSKQFLSVVSEKKTCVAAWNLAAVQARGDILIQLSDDWQPFAGWDTALLKAIGGRGGEFVVAVGDGTRRDDLLCMAILSRGRWEKQGREMFSSEYESMYSDNEYSLRAFAENAVIDARDKIVFKHLHPAFGSAANDATYAHTNHPDRYARGLETFQRRNPAVTAKRMPRFTQAEITMGDAFGQALARYSTGTKCALEIGGGFGDGSTQCINSERLYSVENHPANTARHGAAMAARPGGVAMKCNAVTRAAWLTPEAVAAFYRTTPTRLNQYPLEMVLSWLEEDHEIAAGCTTLTFVGERFDFLLLDGSPFSAEAELAAFRPLLNNSAFVALDDVVDIKNWANYHALKNEPGVRLVWEDLGLRNGAAIFQLP